MCFASIMIFTVMQLILSTARQPMQNTIKMYMQGGLQVRWNPTVKLVNSIDCMVAGAQDSFIVLKYHMVQAIQTCCTWASAFTKTLYFTDLRNISWNGKMYKGQSRDGVLCSIMIMRNIYKPPISLHVVYLCASSISWSASAIL